MKKSIYISDAAQKIIGTIDETTNLSGRINSIIVRYGGITKQSTPELTQGEWMLLIDILNSTWRETESDRMDIARMMWAEVADSEPDGTGKKWGVNIPELSERLRVMPYAEQCAVIEVVCRFWQGHDSQEWESDAARLKYFGAVISE